jgi:hypothetical protein
MRWSFCKNHGRVEGGASAAAFSAALAVLAVGCSADSSGDARGETSRAPTTDLLAGSKNTAGAAPGAPGAGLGAAPAGPSVDAMAGPGSACPKGTANVSPVTPNVWLVIDGSTSMNEDLGGNTRWNALRSALMDPDGVVAQLQHTVAFGMVLYSGPLAPICDGFSYLDDSCGCFTGFEDACCEETCGFVLPPIDYCMAQLAVVDPAIGNHAAIDMQYPAAPVGGWTPTDRALEHVVSQLPAPGTSDPKHPIYALLATDGAPNDVCAEGGGGFGVQPEVMQRVVQTVTDGVQKSMQAFVVSLAGDDADLQTHLEQVAEIGKPGQKPFVPGNKQELIDSLRQIVSGATCQVALDGTVTAGHECDGVVQLNGAALPCSADNGWWLADARTVQLTGDACASFLSTDSVVNAEFSCSVFIPD